MANQYTLDINKFLQNIDFVQDDGNIRIKVLLNTDVYEFCLNCLANGNIGFSTYTNPDEKIENDIVNLESICGEEVTNINIIQNNDINEWNHDDDLNVFTNQVSIHFMNNDNILFTIEFYHYHNWIPYNNDVNITLYMHQNGMEEEYPQQLHRIHI